MIPPLGSPKNKIAALRAGIRDCKLYCTDLYPYGYLSHSLNLLFPLSRKEGGAGSMIPPLGSPKNKIAALRAGVRDCKLYFTDF